MVNNASAIHVMRYSPKGAELGPFEIIGFAMWVIGFYFEAAGDAQLVSHKANPAMKG